MNNRYSLPPGYVSAASSLVGGASGYKQNNGFQGAPYSPNASGYQTVTITFSAAPADASTLQVVDTDANGVPVVKTFTYHYSGSPGAGNIPLVAGGGTAAQAATATAVALAAQLNTWTVTNTVVNRVTMVSTQQGRNVVVPFAGSQATGIFAQNAATPPATLPASIGGRPAQLPYASLG